MTKGLGTLPMRTDGKKWGCLDCSRQNSYLQVSEGPFLEKGIRSILFMYTRQKKEHEAKLAEGQTGLDIMGDFLTISCLGK